MATDRERNDALRRERTARRKVLTRIQRDTRAEVDRLLAEARDRIAVRLADAPSEFDAFILPQLQASIRQAMDDVASGAATASNSAAGHAWQAGIDLVEKPIEAGLTLDGGPRVVLQAVLPAVDTEQLFAMRTFMTGRMRDVTVELANRINSELGLAAIGAQTTGEATTKISDLLKAGGRGRATTIVRTELGRIFSVAGQKRMEQAKPILPGLKKQWRRSGKLFSRVNHDLTDGQIVDVDDSFQVAPGVSLLFPRDPAGPPKETINCGCTILPWMDAWEVRTPGRQPFSRRELDRDPRKRDLESALAGP